MEVEGGQSPEMTKRLETIYLSGSSRREPDDRSRCLLKLWDNEDGAVVMMVELLDNPGQSVTNACEEIATRAVADFGLTPAQTRWFEHYPEERAFRHGKERILSKETFDEIEFHWMKDGLGRDIASTPQWHRVSREEVELLVGEI